jgi:hypothetical protein
MNRQQRREQRRQRHQRRRRAIAQTQLTQTFPQPQFVETRMMPISEIDFSRYEGLPQVQEVAGLPVEDFIVQFRQQLAESGNPVWDTNTTELGFGFPPDHLREIYNSPLATSMIHEDEFIPHPCVFCGVQIDSIHHSGNPFPIFGSRPDETHAMNQNGTERPLRCCSSCDLEIVIPTRMESYRAQDAA